MAGLRQVLYAADDDGKAFRVSAGTAAAYTSHPNTPNLSLIHI